MKILVCGSREWTNKDRVYEVLKDFPTGTVVMHGGCRGADTIAGEVAESLGHHPLVFFAQWKVDGKAAGPIRNTRMITNKPEFIIAFHNDWRNSKGTKDVIEKAKRRCIPVVIVKEDGYDTTY